jgi:hypothetical protein
MINNQRIIKAQVLSVKELESKTLDKRTYLQLHIKNRYVKTINIFENHLEREKWNSFVLGNFYTFSLEKSGEYWRLVDFHLITEREVKAEEKAVDVSNIKKTKSPTLEKPKRKSYVLLSFLIGYLLGLFSLYFYGLGEWVWIFSQF